MVPEAEAFMKEKLFPLFRSYGCIAAYLAVAGSKEAPDMRIISFWESMASLERLTGQAKERGVILPESSRFIQGEPSTEHFDVVGTL